MTDYPAEHADPYCLEPGEAEKLLDGHPWRRFIALGDSIAEGVSETVPGYSPLPFADRVAAELARVRPGLAYLNIGQRGRRAHEVRAEQLADALEFAPDLAFLACGANDALRPGYETRADAVDAEKTAVIRALQEAGALVITVSIFVRPAYPSLPAWLRPTGTERMAELGARTAAIAAALGTVHVDLARHPIAATMDSTCTDGLHGNARAQSVAAAEAIRALGALLRSPAAISRGIGRTGRSPGSVFSSEFSTEFSSESGTGFNSEFGPESSTGFSAGAGSGTRAEAVAVTPTDHPSRRHRQRLRHCQEP